MSFHWTRLELDKHHQPMMLYYYVLNFYFVANWKYQEHGHITNFSCKKGYVDRICSIPLSSSLAKYQHASFKRNLKFYSSKISSFINCFWLTIKKWFLLMIRYIIYFMFVWPKRLDRPSSCIICILSLFGCSLRTCLGQNPATFSTVRLRSFMWGWTGAKTRPTDGCKNNLFAKNLNSLGGGHYVR